MSAYFYATGDSKNATILVYTDPLLFTPIFRLTLPKFIGVVGIWLTYPCTQASTSVLSILLGKLKKQNN